MNAGTSAVGFSVHDFATGAWTARSVTNLPTAWGTDAKLVSTMGSAASIATGTATAGGASTLTNSAKSWATNMWANYQIRITAGTGNWTNTYDCQQHGNGDYNFGSLDDQS